MSKVWFNTKAGSGIGAATARAALESVIVYWQPVEISTRFAAALNDVACAENLALVQLDVTNEMLTKVAVVEAMKGVRAHRDRRSGQ